LGHLTALLPLSRDALRRALVEPAAALGYRFEPAGLADEMVTAVEETRAALPLLAFAVARLWERRDQERACLTREAYLEIGGVAGALAQHAEETLQRIGIEHEPAVREFFRNLVTVQGTRAVIDWDESLSVVPDRGRGESILRELVGARLLTSYEVAGTAGRPGHHRVELAHESLLTAWPRLIRWRTQDEESAQLRDQLRQAAHLWDEKGRTADLLWTGTAYREFALWRDRYGAPLTSVEVAFAAAMTDQARRRRRMAVFAIAAAFLALGPVRGDPQQRAVWLTEPGGQTPREIGRWSPTWDIGTDHLGTRAPTAVDRIGRRLAYARGRDVFVHDLRPLSGAKGTVDRVVGSHDQPVRSLTWHPDGDRLASIDEGGGIRLWQTSTGRVLHETRGPAPHRYTILAFDASGGRLTWSSGAARATCLWEVGSPGAIGPSCFGSDTENGTAPAFDPSGTWLAAAEGGRVTLWPVTAPYARTVPAHAEGPVNYLAFASDSSVLASCARDGLRLTPISTYGLSQTRVKLPGSYFCYGVSPFPSSPDFAVTAPIIGVYRVSGDGASAQLLMPYPDQRIALGGAAVDAAGRLVAVATQYAEDASLMRAHVVDLVTGAQQSLPLRELDTNDPFSGAVRGVAFSHDGDLLTAGDGGVFRWDLSSGRAVRLAGGAGSYATLAGDRDGRRVVAVIGRHAANVQLEGSELRVFDLVANVEQTVNTHGNRLMLALATDPDGRIVVTGDATGVVRVGTISPDMTICL
jgi:WD40 repeat protein